MGLFLVWRHKLLCMHVYKGQRRCKSVCGVNPGKDPCPLLAQSWDRWWQVFVSFTAYRKSKFNLKRRSAFQTGVKIYLNKKSILSLGAINENEYSHVKVLDLHEILVLSQCVSTTGVSFMTLATSPIIFSQWHSNDFTPLIFMSFSWRDICHQIFFRDAWFEILRYKILRVLQ